MPGMSITLHHPDGWTVRLIGHTAKYWGIGECTPIVTTDTDDLPAYVVKFLVDNSYITLQE